MEYYTVHGNIDAEPGFAVPDPTTHCKQTTTTADDPSQHSDGTLHFQAI